MNQTKLQIIRELLAEIEEDEPRYYTQLDSPLGRRMHLELARAGKLPAFKRGRRVFILRSVVHKHIEDNPVFEQNETEDLDEILGEIEHEQKKAAS